MQQPALLVFYEGLDFVHQVSGLHQDLWDVVPLGHFYKEKAEIADNIEHILHQNKIKIKPLV